MEGTVLWGSRLQLPSGKFMEPTPCRDRDSATEDLTIGPKSFRPGLHQQSETLARPVLTTMMEIEPGWLFAQLTNREKKLKMKERSCTKSLVLKKKWLGITLKILYQPGLSFIFGFFPYLAAQRATRARIPSW